MARLNRDFLVPYLQDICSLHLLNYKLDARARELGRAIWRLENDPKPKGPCMPSDEEIPIGSVLALIFCGGALILDAIGIVVMLIGVGGFLGCLLALAVGFGGLILFSFAAESYDKIQSVREKNQRAWDTYHRECDSLDKRVEQWRERRSELTPLKSELAGTAIEKGKVNSLLSKAYSANVIPNQYRNIYAAIYLYQWFEGSSEDDIGMALNTFVLEQVKEKLDRVIENQASIMLGQRMMLANQARSLEQQEEHNSIMRAKVDALQVSVEEQSKYIQMMESTEECSVYFADGEYIRKLF